MPIYEYKRPDGSTFEVVQSFSEAPLRRDPDTGVPVERVLHPPAVHFKGKGFYATDYGTRKRQRESAEETSAQTSPKPAADTASANGSSGDTQPQRKAPSEDPVKPKDSKPVAASS